MFSFYTIERERVREKKLSSYMDVTLHVNPYLRVVCLSNYTFIFTHTHIHTHKVLLYINEKITATLQIVIKYHTTVKLVNLCMNYSIM